MCNHLNMSMEQSRSVSAGFSLDLFKTVKKIMTSVKRKENRREMTQYLILMLPLLETVVENGHVFTPVKYAEMKQHLILYIKHYKNTLAQEMGVAGHSSIRLQDKSGIDLVVSWPRWGLIYEVEFPRKELKY